MKPIGGYFELELNKDTEFHPNAIKVNSGRNAFEYILLANNYKKVYIPYFTCDVLLEPLVRNDISYEFYSINNKLEPIFNFNEIKSNESFLYTNYFGLKDGYISTLSKYCKNLIIDNAQSFYSQPLNMVDTFYSPRKFFGVPDGAYLYCRKELPFKLEQDVKSHLRMGHLIKRVALSAEQGYSEFIENDNSLIGETLKSMSVLTESLLKNIDYDIIASIRQRNYNYIAKKLNDVNEIKLNKNEFQIPMVYPFLSLNVNLRSILIEKRIYTAKYWPNIDKWTNKESIEHNLFEKLIHIPIDQRYEIKDMERIVEIIMKNV